MKQLIMIFATSLILMGCSQGPKDDFINACMEANSGATCSCMYDELESVYGKEGMEKMSAGIFPDDFGETLERLSQTNPCN